MAKLTIFDERSGCFITPIKGVTKNPDGSYEVAPNGGEMTISRPIDGHTDFEWKCDCNQAPTPRDLIINYWMGGKLIVLNPQQVKLQVLGVTSDAKRFEILKPPSLPPTIKFLDVDTGCFFCMPSYPATPNPKPPIITIKCAANGGYIIQVEVGNDYRKDAPIYVMLYDKVGRLFWTQAFTDSKVVSVCCDINLGRAFYVCTGIGQVQIPVPFCKAPPKD